MHSHCLGRRDANLLVQMFKAGLADAHFLLNSKLGDGGVLRGTLPAEDLTTGPAMVLKERGKR